MSTKTALWTPAWYELDQSLRLQQIDNWCFFQRPPEALGDAGNCDLVFFNALTDTSNAEFRRGRIMAIEHPTLGELASIHTHGLDYVFETVDGKRFTVNAEEDPGSSIEQDGELPEIDDWTVVVTLDDVSEPILATS